MRKLDMMSAIMIQSIRSVGAHGSESLVFLSTLSFLFFKLIAAKHPWSDVDCTCTGSLLQCFPELTCDTLDNQTIHDDDPCVMFQGNQFILLQH